MRASGDRPVGAELRLVASGPERIEARSSSEAGHESWMDGAAPRGASGTFAVADDDGAGGGGGPHSQGLFSAAELAVIERDQADGLTAVQIIEMFTQRGVRFSEATFRKYVQLGLLPRSRRIGRKGKHRGSLGMYPAKTIRRINVIKQYMEDGYTIEQIQEQFLRFTNAVESVEEAIDELFTAFEAALGEASDDGDTDDLDAEIAASRRLADKLLERIRVVTDALSSGGDDHYQTPGAAGSAEDLL